MPEFALDNQELDLRYDKALTNFLKEKGSLGNTDEAARWVS
jgi:hypothetical protein